MFVRKGVWNGGLVALVAGAGLVALAAVAQAEPIRVALVPIAVNSASAETHHVSRGLADMLASRLEREGEISVIQIHGEALDGVGAVEAGRQVGAGFVLFGSYTQFGDGASLDLRFVSTQGAEADEPRRVFIQAATPGEIIPRLDELAQRISGHLLGEGGARDMAVSTGPPAREAASAGAPGRTQVTDREFSALLERIEALESAVYSDPPAGETETGE